MEVSLRGDVRAGGTMKEYKNKRWWMDGLYFSCLRCGRCCGGEPGYVWLDTNEIFAIANFLEMDVGDTLRSFARRVSGRISLMELENGDCVFLADGRCRIYPVRPLQCRTYPFWPSVLQSPRSWRLEGQRCPGIGQGSFYPQETIERLLSHTSASGL